jgi:hypothetical protein
MITNRITIYGILWTLAGIAIILGAFYVSQLPCAGCSTAAFQNFQQSVDVMAVIGIIAIVLGLSMLAFRRKISRM